MPRIFDNIEFQLLPALQEAMDDATSADFCVGYFNLRGWEHLADLAEHFTGDDDSYCRILVGMQKPPEDQVREAYRAIRKDESLDPPAVAQLRKQAAESFRMQLSFGVPTNQAEAALNRLTEHLRVDKVRVKLFLRHALHAKLYLVHRSDTIAQFLGFVGSSNLTQSGLMDNGELNVDVLEQDATSKLHDWFHKHWDDRYSYDISEKLAQLIEESWAAADMVRPYLAYLKMVYHLSQDALVGEKEFKLPGDLQGKLLTFQTAAVSLGARHLHARGGVLLGGVVGLGKTFMAIAVARIMQDDGLGATLIICPPNLQDMSQEADIVYYTRKLRYFVQFFDLVPEVRDEHGQRRDPAELKSMQFGSETDAQTTFAALNSSLFFWFLTAYSDCRRRHVNRRETYQFPFTAHSLSDEHKSFLATWACTLMAGFQAQALWSTVRFRSGTLQMQFFQPRLSKPIIDDIDRVLTEHYGFTDEELDFIINYDIKYRMEADEGEE